MTKFTDGPAHGVTLMLRRAPYFLRVVHDGKYDALDLIDDRPSDNETLHLYRITKVPGWCHIKAKSGGGFYTIAEYAYLPEQPADAILRDNDRFADWCGEQTEDLKKWAAMLGEEKGN